MDIIGSSDMKSSWIWHHSRVACLLRSKNVMMLIAAWLIVKRPCNSCGMWFLVLIAVNLKLVSALQKLL